MAGLFVELAVSWLLLRFFAHQGLGALGISPRKSRVVELCGGMLLAGLVGIIYYSSTAYLAADSWHLNPAYDALTGAMSTYWTWKSVMFETLIFQGALLYLALARFGTRRACLLSALGFGVYHWFSYGAFGNPVLMAFILLSTGLTGLLYAYAFAQTGSIYLPVGLHLGWNWVTIVLFSKGPLGLQLLRPEHGAKLHGAAWLLTFLFQVLALPLLMYFYLRRANRSVLPLPR